ncbi:MAG: hypothetical protein ACP5N9_06280 [Candidatus Bilamarchaeum sp.]|jgi:hypothetical protein
MLKNDNLKNFAVLVLAIIAIALTYKFYYSSNQEQFIPGKNVSSTNFTGIFNNAPNVFILMDVRGVQNSTTKTNILQCGVDFAASNAMGGKNVTYLSISEDGCVSLDGKKPSSYCFSSLSSGLTIYVKEGNSTSFYDNGMIVGIGSSYNIGSCGIRKVSLTNSSS